MYTANGSHSSICCKGPLPSLYPHPSTKHGSFQSHPHTTSEMLKVINFPNVVQQHYVCEEGKSITFVFLFISIYSVPNIVEIGQHI